jgi:hypothetical protein
MTMEIRGLLERELAETIGQAGIVNVPVLPGAASGERPDHYVAVVAQEAEQKPKGAYLIELDIFCVSPIDDDYGIEQAKNRAAKIEEWLQDASCPLSKGSNADGSLLVHGFRLASTNRVSKERSAAEVLNLVVAASVVYPDEDVEEEEVEEEEGG